jgi:hypothetical protein
MIRFLLLAAALAVLAACRTAPAPPKEVSAASLVDRAGDSIETAVEVPADAPAGGIQFENGWIFDRYGKFRRTAGGTGTANDRRCDVVKIELPNGDAQSVYFDITENWKHWSPPRQ